MAFFLGIIFTSLPLSFAESDIINKIQKSHSLMQDDQAAPSFGTRLNKISEEFSEVSVTAILPDYSIRPGEDALYYFHNPVY